MDVAEVLLAQGGFKSGGFNFDAKPRRESFNPMDLVTGHVGGMDAYAFGLLAAENLSKHAGYQSLVGERYNAWTAPIGQEIESGKHSLTSLAAIARGEPMPFQTRSGGYEQVARIRQEIILETAVAESKRGS